MYKGFMVAENCIDGAFSFMLFDERMNIIQQLPNQLKGDKHLQEKGSHIDFVGDLAHVDYFHYDGYLLPFEPYESTRDGFVWQREYMPTGAPMLNKMPPNIACIGLALPVQSDSDSAQPASH